MHRIILTLSIFFLFACNQTASENGNQKEQSTSVTPKVVTQEDHDNFQPKATGGAIGKGLNMTEVIEKRGGRMLDNACSIIPRRVIAEALGKNAGDFKLSNSTPRDANPTHSSCFFKWSDFDVPNAAILIQMMRNPVGDEFPDWVVQFITSKKEMGESTTDGDRDVFKTFEGFGDDGAYSTVGGKYFWRLGDQVVFSIAFNSAHSPEDQYEIAVKLATVLTQNYLARAGL